MISLRVACIRAVLLAAAVLTQQTFAAAEPGLEDLGQAADKTMERIRWGLQQLESHEDVGRKAGKFIEQHAAVRTINIAGNQFPDSPERHPLLENDGAEPENKSKKEYTRKDSYEVAMNDKTFPSCFEDRRVHDPVYEGICQVNCPEYAAPVPGCFAPLLMQKQEHYVSESYFPIYQVRIFPGRAMGSFNVKGSYLAPEDRRPELTLSATKKRLDSEIKPLVKQTMRALGLPEPQDEKHFIEQAVYDDMEWKGHDGIEPSDGSPYSFHSLTYWTNVHRVATRSRPEEEWKGYLLEKDCFWHTLDNPAKEVIGNATYGATEYLLASMFAKETQQIDPLAADATVLRGPKNLSQAIENIRPQGDKQPQQLQQLNPSQRMSEWNWMRPGLQAVGFTPTKLKRDYVFYGGDLAPFTSANYNAFHDPLYAAIFQGVTHYYMNGLPEVRANTWRRRSIQLARYMNREAKDKMGYSGEDPVLQEPIVVTPKIQVAYSPLEESGTRLGSWCFRPENIARLEPPQPEGDLAKRSKKTTSSGHFSIPLDLDRRFLEVGIQGLNYASEVRLIFWIKRVNCFCEICGTIRGCLNLNDGDLKEDLFYGQEPFGGGALSRALPGLMSSAKGAAAGSAAMLAKSSGRPWGPAYDRAHDDTKQAALDSAPLAPGPPVPGNQILGLGLGTPGMLGGNAPTKPQGIGNKPFDLSWLQQLIMLCVEQVLQNRGQNNAQDVKRQFRLYRYSSRNRGATAQHFLAEPVGAPFYCSSPEDCAADGAFSGRLSRRGKPAACMLVDAAAGKFACMPESTSREKFG